jgi:ATP-binding protein involved in chromosome partitioning
MEPAVAGCGDEGAPAVLRYPNSESAKVFMQTADTVVRALAVFDAEGDGVLKNFNYEFEQLPVEEA